MKYISNIFFLCLVNVAIAQKIDRDYKPSAIRIGWDALSSIRSGYDNGFNRIEGQADIDLHHMFFAIDVGHEKNTSASDDFTYENKGSYLRVGIQANIQPYNVNRNVLFFGLRYARAGFEDNLNFTNSTDNFGNAQFSLSNDNLKAKWMELNMGMKVKVVKQLYFGYTIHFKFAQTFSGEGLLTPRNIPGFGKSDKKSAAGFSYYIAYRIPFRNKPVSVKPKKAINKEIGN